MRRGARVTEFSLRLLQLAAGLNHLLLGSGQIGTSGFDPSLSYLSSGNGLVVLLTGDLFLGNELLIALQIGVVFGCCSLSFIQFGLRCFDLLERRIDSGARVVNIRLSR